jgi:membrane fusion protein (multidrug efflux system)
MPEGEARAGLAQADRPLASMTPRRGRRRWLRPLLMLVLPLLLAAGALLWWLEGGRWTSTDNAYVQADRLLLVTDVSGTVLDIAVREGEAVARGQVLFRLDPAPFRHAANAARASLEQTALALRALQADAARIARDIAAQEAAVQLAQVQHDRQAQLMPTQAVSRAAFDVARFGLLQAQHRLASLHAEAEVNRARLGGDPAASLESHPQYLEARARLEEAERQLARTAVRAPFDGVVTRVAQLQPGHYLEAASPAFALVSSRHVWIDAQPKETELTHVRPGNPARITIDTYPGRVWHGEVESISPASGATFSVLPAQNVTGNWVKVVQRIPVRIRVESSPDAPPLRAGMSAIVEIDTGHRRRLSDLWR